MKPTIGRVVVYRSRTGRYAVPAIITATSRTLFQPAVDGGHIPALSSDTHVHLTVLTPGTPGERLPNTDPAIASVNAGGTYQEWDVPFAEHADTVPGEAGPEHTHHQPPGSWAWPERTS